MTKINYNNGIYYSIFQESNLSFNNGINYKNDFCGLDDWLKNSDPIQFFAGLIWICLLKH